MQRLKILILAGLLLSLAAQTPDLPIGAIQGSAAESPLLNRFVSFRGVVVGRYEDRNTRGDVYYTLFVQSLPEESDGDPATSDAVAVFLGRDARPDVALGDRVRVGGKVTEFYGLTEIDDRGLTVVVESHGPLPAPAPLDPPAGVAAAAIYFEALEGMRVAFDGETIVAGPTHEGCGFAVIAATHAATLPVARRAVDDPTGRIVPVLHPSDLACADMPQLKTGDRLRGVAGAMTYNFDQFKIVLDSAEQLTITESPLTPVAPLPALVPEQIAIASINAEDTFDTTRDTAEEGEPVPTADELAARQAKFVHLIAVTLACPTVIGLQEIEHEALLTDLAAALAGPCGFVYQVSHRETPDARGIDNALLSDPRRVRVDAVALRPACSPVPTEVSDATLTCPAGESPLFGRPPLQVDATIDGQPYTLWVNHFKSKRDGETETGLERIQQAVYLNGLAAERLAARPDARLITLGDFNDTELSPALALLTDPAQGGQLDHALAAVPNAARYSYVFGGVAELIDGILLSPALAEDVGLATIRHVNADYPAGWRLDTSAAHLAYRATDHDVPLVILGQWPEATATPPSLPAPTAPATAVATSAPTATPPAALPTLAPTVAASPVPVAAVASDRDYRVLVMGIVALVLLCGALLVRWLARR